MHYTNDIFKIYKWYLDIFNEVFPKVNGGYFKSFLMLMNLFEFTFLVLHLLLSI